MLMAKQPFRGGDKSPIVYTALVHTFFARFGMSVLFEAQSSISTEKFPWSAHRQYPDLCPGRPFEVVAAGINLVPRELSEKEIFEAIESYARAAENAKKSGFDGVEIHGAHGYLVDLFLWDETNKRTDAWGGSLENKMRFAKEIVSAIRRKVGQSDFVFRNGSRVITMRKFFIRLKNSNYL